VHVLCMCMCMYVCVPFIWESRTLRRQQGIHTLPSILICLNSLMVGPLPNFHVANASPPVLLSYYLLKFIFHVCYPRPSGGCWGKLGPLFPGSSMISMRSLSSAALKPGSYSFLAWRISFLPLVPLTTNPKVPPLSSCPAIGCWQLYVPTRTNRGQEPSASYLHTDSWEILGTQIT